MNAVSSSLSHERSPKRYRVALFNSSDPRGKKIGGIQTYTRDYIHYHPEDMDLLLIGADETGEMPIGEVSEIEFRGRTFKFLPLYRLESTIADYTKGVTGSDTFTFARALVKNWGKIRKILKDGGYTAEIRRVEYAPIIWSMGVPFIQMVHIWGGKDQPMSSSLGKHWYIRGSTELVAAALCEKYYSVNQYMTEMYKKKFFPFAKKFDTLTTWANTHLFKPTPFSVESGKIEILYAGRMDRFKRPDYMFRALAQLQEKTGRVRFNYVGDGDVEAIEEFHLIRDITVRHGVKTSAEIGELLTSMHMGLLTSDFEGMPRVVLEVLSSGRPVVAMHLPQLEPVIEDGVSGFLVPRAGDHIATLAARMGECFDLIAQGRIDPEKVASYAAPYSPYKLLGRIWKDHRRLQGLAE